MQIDAERLVADYSDLILRLSYTYLGSKQDAEDICQNVLLKLITSQPTFSSKEHEKAWVIRVTANACKDLLKSAAWQRTVGLEGFDDSGLEPMWVKDPSGFLDLGTLQVMLSDGSVIEVVDERGGSLDPQGDVLACEKGIFLPEIIDVERVASVTICGTEFSVA